MTIESISERLKEYSEVLLIYCTISRRNDGTVIDYAVVCDTDNVIANDDLIRTFEAIKDIIKELYKTSNDMIKFKWQIISANFFEEKFAKKEFRADLKDAFVIYSKDEYLSDIIEASRDTHARQ